MELGADTVSAHNESFACRGVQGAGAHIDIRHGRDLIEQPRVETIATCHHAERSGAGKQGVD